MLQNSDDLKTSACCIMESIPGYQKEILKQIDDEILRRFYGCGSPIPLALEGKTVLDLGCGTGRYAFGFNEPNILFRKGYIEDLATAGIQDNSVDVVISNCAKSLTPIATSLFGDFQSA